MKEKVINNLGDLHDMALSYYSSHPIYRGVKNSEYELNTRFRRSIIKNKNQRDTIDTFNYEVNSKSELEVLDEFKKLSVPHLTHTPTNDWEWLALGQHHGLSTRMMDWTRNPLVAAFFACYFNNNDSDAAIYVLADEKALETAPLSASPFDVDSALIFNPHHTTTRITAQSGLFTVHPENEDVFENEGLCKWTIKNECKIDIEIMLFNYGIHYASMFPGLDGITKFLMHKHGL